MGTLGLLLALASALTFGTAGTLASGLIDSGWSPAAAVTWRVTIATAVLAIPAAIELRGRWQILRRGWRTIVGFGLVGIAMTQLAYFQAVQRLDVGVALLLEYLGVVLVVGWLWLRHGQRPRRRSIIGSGLAIIGLIAVLDLTGAAALDPWGVMWGLIAAIGLASYFVVSADNSTGVPPLTLAAGGMAVAAASMWLSAATGLTTITTSTTSVELAGHQTPWWVAVAALGLVATTAAYALGIAANRLLGSKLASFVGLTEVVFAVLIAWLVLGQLPVPMQLLGGVAILAGVVAVKLDERSETSQAPAGPAHSGYDEHHAR
ncbi:MAG: EamA family transporter [Beutenbergiaceae bacterium]